MNWISVGIIFSMVTGLGLDYDIFYSETVAEHWLSGKPSGSEVLVLRAEDVGFLAHQPDLASHDAGPALRALLAACFRWETLCLYSTGTSLETLLGMTMKSGALPAMKTLDSCTPARCWQAATPAWPFGRSSPRTLRWRRSDCIARARRVRRSGAWPRQAGRLHASQTLGSRDAGASLLAFLATCPTLETFSGIARARRRTRSRARPKRAGRSRPRRRWNSCMPPRRLQTTTPAWPCGRSSPRAHAGDVQIV